VTVFRGFSTDHTTGPRWSVIEVPELAELLVPMPFLSGKIEDLRAGDDFRTSSSKEHRASDVRNCYSVGGRIVDADRRAVSVVGEPEEIARTD
jgi:hypothetical protein